MGILEVLTGPQEPQRAVEHVRRQAGCVPVFKRFMALLAAGMKDIRSQVKGELEIEGLFYLTRVSDVVELRIQVLHRTPKGRITHACGLLFHLKLNAQGQIVEILSSTALPPEEG